MCRCTFDKAADTNTETEGLNHQPFSYWTRWPTDFPDTFLLFTGAWTSVFTTKSIKTEVQLQNFKPTQKKKKKNLLTSWVIEQIPNRRRSWTKGSVCILIISQKYTHFIKLTTSHDDECFHLGVVGLEVVMAVYLLTQLTCVWHLTAHPMSMWQITFLNLESWQQSPVCAVRLSDTHLFISSTQVHSSLFQCSAWGHQGGFYVINLIERWRT